MTERFDNPRSAWVQPGGQRLFGGAVVVSLLLHAAIALALVDGGNQPGPSTDEVTVELVPQPEAEEQKPEPPKEVKQEEPNPQREEQAQLDAEAPPTPTTLPVLKPVVEFGERDGGSRAEPNGGATEPPAEAEQIVAELEEAEPDAPEPETDAVVEAEAEPDESGEVGPIAAPAKPRPRPARKTAAAPLETDTEANIDTERKAMTPAKQLFSDAMLSDPRVQTAMANVPRSERGKLLCMTEMRGQLLAASPPRPPEILPSYALSNGTVLEPRQAAFRSRGQWFDLAFRCEVDEPVTKVVNFSYRIGKAIPREEWSDRGFLDY